jgi:6-phosphofructokinase 1
MAYDAGKEAVEAARRGEQGVLPVIKKLADKPFMYGFETVKLEAVADLEKTVPDEFITEDGMDVTQAALDYLSPLIQGEHPVNFIQGLPDISPIKITPLAKQLANFNDE